MNNSSKRWHYALLILTTIPDYIVCKPTSVLSLIIKELCSPAPISFSSSRWISGPITCLMRAEHFVLLNDLLNVKMLEWQAMCAASFSSIILTDWSVFTMPLSNKVCTRQLENGAAFRMCFSVLLWFKRSLWCANLCFTVTTESFGIIPSHTLYPLLNVVFMFSPFTGFFFSLQILTLYQVQESMMSFRWLPSN